MDFFCGIGGLNCETGKNSRLNFGSNPTNPKYILNTRDRLCWQYMTNRDATNFQRRYRHASQYSKLHRILYWILCLQISPIGRVESFRSWSSHLFRGRPCGRRHVRSGGRLSDTLMWSWRAMFAGESSSSRATCPNTEMRRPSTR